MFTFMSQETSVACFGYTWANSVRKSTEFVSCPHGKLITDGDDFSIYGLNVRDFLYLEWEDEPVEVFINLED